MAQQDRKHLEVVVPVAIVEGNRNRTHPATHPGGKSTDFVDPDHCEVSLELDELALEGLGRTVYHVGIELVFRLGVGAEDAMISKYGQPRKSCDRAELQKGGKVRFAVDAPGMTQQVDEIKRQQGEYYAREHAVEKGQMVGAQYRMEGNITSIVKQIRDTKDVYYKVNLQLWNIRNGLLEWSDEKEIRKTTTRG